MKIFKAINTIFCDFVFRLLQVDFLPTGVQDAKKNYLIKPPSAKTINAAGSTITYGKKSGREYVHIPGPIKVPLRFVVRH